MKLKNLAIHTIATIVLIMHFAWIILLVGGTIFIFFKPWYVKWHLFIVSFTLLLNLFIGYCPLTRWEEKIRQISNPKFDYNGSFASKYIHKFFGIRITPKEVIKLLTFIKVFSYAASVFIVLTK